MERIVPTRSWSDLALNSKQSAALHELVDLVRQRRVAPESTWGLEGRAGVGVTALFSGVSGTAKTIAAEVVAQELGLDLCRVSLSAITSRYIGETEKNLRVLFAAADPRGVAILLDEADALFAKRSEVSDSHDRYANQEVSYLLQKMEEYTGLTILTSNLPTAIDPAFLRRFRFVVAFG